MRITHLPSSPPMPTTVLLPGIAVACARPPEDEAPRWRAEALTPAAQLADLVPTICASTSPPGNGARLLQDLQRELPALSPKLRAVARYCMAHATRLHLQRVQDVAADCGTVPVTVVRLAQRFGFRGFQEMKLAFLDLAFRADGTPDPIPSGPDSIPASPSRTPGTCAAQALCDLDASAHALGELRSVVQTPDFEHLVLALRTTRCIRFDWAGETDRTIALHMRARLRAHGCHQVGASMPPAGVRGEWLVHVAVWDDKTPARQFHEASMMGTRLLRMTRGHGHPVLRRANDGTAIPCGNDSRRLLTALAFSELLADLLAPQRLGRP